jgi:hypothetical protein
VRRTRLRSFLCGVLVGNSAPHLASALAGRRHLTPLAGRDSGQAVNALWGGLNLAGGLLLLPAERHRTDEGWDDDLLAFEGGFLALAAWMFATEWTLRTNTGGVQSPARGRPRRRAGRVSEGSRPAARSASRSR